MSIEKHKNNKINFFKICVDKRPHKCYTIDKEKEVDWMYYLIVETYECEKLYWFSDDLEVLYKTKARYDYEIYNYTIFKVNPDFTLTILD